jgi:outer membrane lipoprotein carrier protein
MPTIVMAQSANDNLNQALKNIHSMRADFTQKIVDHKGKEIHKSYGSMAIKRPGKFRWETTSPNKQLVIASGKRLWIYDADFEQVVIRALAKQTGETPALLLSDVNPNFETDYHIKLEKTSSKESQHYLLTPIDPNSMFQAIRMVFQQNALEEMELQDHLGHNTLIKFSHIKLNVSIADGYFHFSPPKNVDIIDETR